MKVAFSGVLDSFDYHHVGGMDSLTRRLALGMLERGHTVDFIHFNAPEARTERPTEGLKLIYTRTFMDALEIYGDSYDHIVTIFMPLKYRLAFSRFRRENRAKVKFHLVLSGWPESGGRRFVRFLEPRLAPYNGTIFCLSPRLYAEALRYKANACLLLPPVPDDYFLTTAQKTESSRLRLTFIGRIDPGKGIHRVIDFFQHLANTQAEVETHIWGYPWKHKPETMKIHEQLLHQHLIRYTPIDFQNYSEKLDGPLKKILVETDILFLPYERLSSSIDTPLLVLEGMASLCAIMTRPLGDIPDIYGSRTWMITSTENSELASLVEKLQRTLSSERDRLEKRNKELRFNQDHIVELFLAELERT